MCIAVADRSVVVFDDRVMIFSEKTKTQPITKEQVWAVWLHVRVGGKGMGIDLFYYTLSDIIVLMKQGIIPLMV